MKFSYNWLKAYIPNAPEIEKLSSILSYHLFEVEGIETKDGDNIFDIKILPNRAHDLLSHYGLAREIAALCEIDFKDPTEMYKIPESKPTNLKIEIQTDKCRRYMGRIVRNVTVGKSPEWVVKHLESIGARSINSVVDAANIVMFDCGQPMHCFDLDKVKGSIVVRAAKDGEEITTLDNKQIKLNSSNTVIADDAGPLAIAGVKGGKRAEVDDNTKNIIIESANFDPTSTRKTAKMVGILTDAVKRYENDLSPELCSYAMREICGLFVEYGFKDFEEIVDIYPNKQAPKKLSFSRAKISKILGIDVKDSEIENILKRYNFVFTNKEGNFEISVPLMRLDLNIGEDMAEEVGRVLGYDKLKIEIPKINFTPKVNDTYAKVSFARNKLLTDGYSEVMTYAFANKGEVEVLESASDKKFLRSNISDGLKEAIKLNQNNLPVLGVKEVKIFEIGTVFKKGVEVINVAFGDKKSVKEMSLEEYITENSSSKEHGYFSAEKFLVLAPSRSQVSLQENSPSPQLFVMWPLFPFIARDVAVWVPEDVSSEKVASVIRGNMGSMVVRGPELFDEFKKEGKVSYAFRIVFQSYDKTLTDMEVNQVMENINKKLLENSNWQVR